MAFMMDELFNEEEPKQIHRTCKDCASNHICNITHTDDGLACIDYKADAITEIEKIYDEMYDIDDILKIKGNGSFETTYIRLGSMMHILDKHLAEIKGENE